MVDSVPNLHFLDTGQCFPRYRYTSSEAQGKQRTLSLGDVELTRVDNIPIETVSLFRRHYRGKDIDADAVFYYGYGLLHSPDYKTRFAADLKKMLPRIPHANSVTDFRAFSDAGKALAKHHIGYEEEEGWPLAIREEKETLQVQVKNGDMNEDEFLHKLYRVSKMGFHKIGKATDKTRIKYNEYITVEGIPLDAYDYVVNGKSAIEWVIERHRVTQHKDSIIIDDPNT